MHLIFVGFMGSGKSTLGKRIANKIGKPFIDMDVRLEEMFGCSITKFIEEFGMESFRQEESELLRIIMSEPSSVIATGGGTPSSKGSMEWMRKHGVVVHLSVTPKVLAKRLEGNCENRPLLSEVLPPDLERTIGRQLLVRAASYSGANTKWDEEEFDDELIDAKLEAIGWRMREVL
jgi:shikimate kinase